MNSSGIKRGLAVTAISALAVTGLPGLVGSASAQPLDSAQAATAVTIYSQSTSSASTQNDGVNSTVHLLAGAGADVKQVRFQYKVFGGESQAIATVSRANGGFSAEWAPPANVLGAFVTIEAVGLDAAGTAITGSVSAPRSVALGAGSTAVDITNARGSEIGVFTQPYASPKSLAAVSGTTSSKDAPEVSSPSGSGKANPADVFPADPSGVSAFSGVVDLSGYKWSKPTTVDGVTSTAADEAVIVATAGSDDAEIVKLYEQTIATVTAAASPELVQGSAKSAATVTVRDQKGKPVAGAQVENEAGDIKLTNSVGQAVFADLAGSAAGESYKFHVNTTEDAGYQSADDFQRTVTVKSYTPSVESIAASSKDGAAFDFDENEAGDIKVTAKDQNGAATTPITGVQGTWTIKPFDAKVADSTVKATINAATGNVDFPVGQPAGRYTLNTWIEKDGTPGQGAGDLSAAPLTVKAGQAEITWDTTAVQVQSGTTSKQGGTIALEDGTVLGGRTATVTFTAKDDAKLAASQPAGTTRVSDTEATVKTAADGTFSVAVADAAAVAPDPQLSEIGGLLDAKSDDLKIDLADTTDLKVDFVDLAVKTIAIGAGDKLVDGEATPGRPVSYTVTVTNKDGDPLKNAAVSLSLDHGFFTTYADSEAKLTPATALAVGGLYGVWKDEGKTKSATTDANGKVTVTVAIGRDAGFDDDGRVDAKLTVKAGSVTNDETVTEFDSADPLNPGSATVEIAPGQAKSLPKAQLAGTSKVFLDVFVKDQFGNLTDEAVDVSDDTNDADLSAGTVRGQFEADKSVLSASSDSSTDLSQSIKVAWDTESNVWKDSDPVKPEVQGARDEARKTVSGTETIDWYAINHAAGDYTLTSNAEGDQLPGKTVIVTYTALDQNGMPIKGAQVDFFRSGPDDLQNGESRDTTTDEDGVATYVFQGAKEGTATVTAVLRKGSNPVAASTKEVKVVFAKPVVTPPAPATIVAKLLGSSNGKSADEVTVNAPSSAKGAAVKLYKAVSGKRKLVASGTLNSNGNKVFKVKDANGTKATKYIAVVSATAKTKSDTTNTKTVK
ncbi:MAG: hypothetical protein JWQ91_3154 [Aeromicrobium sp.]|jgi:protocatechuate 3,4-dioxygenase beta subunit|uniref:Ig-like domain-containing protein n=1 Tax=Aeromicrobium sp. TaxID=1871063 RepID=UPI0026078298|nr:Ig-like domain-containing protein [Aeromicrobium sp.]MCW2826237.1 hypothetical protein [Aeromicrobium sp.]